MNYIVDDEKGKVIPWESDVPPESYDGVFVPEISEPPAFDPATQTLSDGGLEVERDAGVPVRVRRLWVLRDLTPRELDDNQVAVEMQQVTTAIDLLIADREILNGAPTNAQVLGVVRNMITIQIRHLKYERRLLNAP